MKNISSILIVLLLILFGCDDVLEQLPRDSVDLEGFFQTGNDLEVAVNDLYSILPNHTLYIDDSNSDNIVGAGFAERIKGNRTVPTAKGSGGWSWSQLRKINFVLSNYNRVDDKQAREQYSGVARFFRAFFYFEKVKRFGDVPWYNKMLEVGDEDIYKPRDSRELIVDSIMNDLNYAIKYIPAKKEVFEITKYTALALKARVGLYEGTFRKYHNLGNYEKYLEAAASAANEIIESGAYQLYNGSGGNNGYRELFELNDQNNVETILARKYRQGINKHDVGYRMTAPTLGAWGLTKDLVFSYLNSDGTRFTEKPGYETMGFYDQMQNRDPRLTQTTAGPNFTVSGESSPEPVNLAITRTGYRVIKGLPPRDQWASNSVNDIIIFRLGEVLLNYAEAKAELGNLTQADLDKSVNKLRDRAGMPPIVLDYANANPDSYQDSIYFNVNPSNPNKGVILEIRRERRIELVNEGFRWDDLMRWKEGKKLETPLIGLYIAGPGAYDFNNDGVPDVYVYKDDNSNAPSNIPNTAMIDLKQVTLRNPFTGEIGGETGNIMPYELGHFDEAKDYLYPIPKEDLELNKSLVQNPGW